MFYPSRFVNHAIYFGCFSPNPTNETRLPTTKLLNDIISTFGSYEAFKEQFTQEAVSLFGSGTFFITISSITVITELFHLIFTVFIDLSIFYFSILILFKTTCSMCLFIVFYLFLFFSVIVPIV